MEGYMYLDIQAKTLVSGLAGSLLEAGLRAAHYYGTEVEIGLI